MSDAIRVLVYGDSNSWGYLDDGQGVRCLRRWPQEMLKHLQRLMSIELIEECLPGRTTNLADPVMGASFDGQLPLEALLLSHQPLDHVLIMLGTNDLKARFNRTADDIAKAIVDLGRFAVAVPAGRGGWSSSTAAQITVICPLIIGQRACAPTWERVEEWVGANKKSAALPSLLERACKEAGLGYIDGNQFGRSSQCDPIHWSEQTHVDFGAGMAQALQNDLVAKR